jgi:hypothetical protein
MIKKVAVSLIISFLVISSLSILAHANPIGPEDIVSDRQLAVFESIFLLLMGFTGLLHIGQRLIEKASSPTIKKYSKYFRFAKYAFIISLYVLPPLYLVFATRSFHYMLNEFYIIFGYVIFIILSVLAAVAYFFHIKSKNRPEN